MVTSDVLTAVLAVLTGIADWFADVIPVITGIFWGAEGLTFIGVLAVIGVGVAVVLLVMNIIRSFLSFR